jgi:hypothetical protein
MTDEKEVAAAFPWVALVLLVVVIVLARKLDLGPGGLFGVR